MGIVNEKRRPTGHGKSINGLAIEQSYISIQERQRIKNKQPMSNDSKNRQQIKDRIENKVKEHLKENKFNAKEVEAIIDVEISKILEEPIAKEFDYLTKNGIDLRSTIKNWVGYLYDPKRVRFINKSEEIER